MRARPLSCRQSLKQKEQGIAPLAERVLRSVFTVETDVAFGSGFAAWVDDRAAYVLTAAHVVGRQFHGGVTLTRKGGGLREPPRLLTRQAVRSVS